MIVVARDNHDRSTFMDVTNYNILLVMTYYNWPKFFELHSIML